MDANEPKHPPTTWDNKRRVRRFLYLLSPEGQLSSHPVMGLLWVVAVFCAVVAVIELASGRPGWGVPAGCAAALFANMLLGSLVTVIFEERLGEEAPEERGSQSTQGQTEPVDPTHGAGRRNGTHGPAIQPPPGGAPPRERRDRADRLALQSSGLAAAPGRRGRMIDLLLVFLIMKR